MILLKYAIFVSNMTGSVSNMTVSNLVGPLSVMAKRDQILYFSVAICALHTICSFLSALISAYLARGDQSKSASSFDAGNRILLSRELNGFLIRR